MPDWLDISSAAQLFSPSLLVPVLIYLAVFALLIVYFDSFCRALEPRVGSLEWIHLYDRPRFSLSGRRFRLDRGDWLPLLLLSSSAVGFVAFGVVQLVSQTPPDWAAVLRAPDNLLTGVGGSALYVGLSMPPCYTLLRTVFGRRSVAIAGAVVFALNLMPGSSGPSLSVPCLLLSAIFFFRWMTTDCDARFRSTLPPLLLWLVFFWLAVWCSSIALWFGVGYVVLLIVSFVFRLRERHERGGALHLALTVGTIAICTVLFAALRCLPAAIFEFDMALPQLLAQRRFWRYVLVHTLSFEIWIDAEGLLAVSLLNQPLWWGGLLAALLAIVCTFSRRDPAALFTAVFYLAGTLVWIFAGSGIGAAAATMSMCCIWTGFLRRGKAAPFWLCAGICALLAVAMVLLLLFS